MTFGVVGGTSTAANCFVECFRIWMNDMVGGALYLADGFELRSLTNRSVRLLTLFP